MFVQSFVPQDIFKISLMTVNLEVQLGSTSISGENFWRVFFFFWCPKMAVYCISTVCVTWLRVHPCTMLFFEKYFFFFDTFPNTCSLPPWLQNSQSPMWRSIRTKCPRDSCPLATSKQMEEVATSKVRSETQRLLLSFPLRWIVLSHTLLRDL